MTGVAAVAVFLAVVLGLGPFAVVFVVAVAAAAAVRRRPEGAFAVGVAAIAIVPIYAGRYLPGTAVAVTPAAAVAIILAPAAFDRRHLIRFNGIDVCVVAFVVF